MTLDEAIKHAEEVADKKDREKKKWERWLENDSDYRAVTEKASCELCAEEHRQLAEWLKELKQLREQTRWIPVSKRLPHKGEYGKVYVTYIPSGGTLWTTVIIAHYSDLMGISKPSFHIGEVGKKSFQNITKQVIAWMPLPAPFETQESEEQE